MKKWSLILLAVICFFYWKKSQKPSVIADAKAPEFREIVTTSSCQGKTACILVYVTPWCPACESLSPVLLQWQKKAESDPDFGIKFIVGLEKNSGDNKKLAERYGENCLIDDDKAIHTLLSIHYYPTILMVEKNGVIAKRDNDVLNWAASRYQLHP